MVRNGSLANFGTGVLVGSRSLVDHVKVLDPNIGIQTGNRSQVFDSQVVDASHGIDGSAHCGIHAGGYVRGNVLFMNAGDGIELVGAGVVQHNAVRANNGAGIRTVTSVGGALDSVSVLENTLFLNGGFGIDAAVRTGLTRNVINLNSGGTLNGLVLEMDENVCNSDAICP